MQAATLLYQICACLCFAATTIFVTGVVGVAHDEQLLYVFGDSYTDTGNHDPNTKNVTLIVPWRKPYGIRWPGSPSGRYSDGRVLTDFVASHLGLDMPLPYRYVTSNNLTEHKIGNKIGINFAYGGSGLFPTFGPDYPTITAQINQLKMLINKNIATNVGAHVLFAIAGNDYYAYEFYDTSNQSIHYVASSVVQGMGNALEELYTIGFRRFIVTKIEPFGCVPFYASNINNQTICNETLNSWSSLHNQLLMRELGTLKKKLKDAKFMVLDLETTFLEVLQDNSRYKNIQRGACCSVINGANCGDKDDKGRPLYTLCSSPEKYFFFDEFHPTQTGWKIISNLIFKSLHE